MQKPWYLTTAPGVFNKMEEKVNGERAINLLGCPVLYGSGGAGLSVPRSRLKTEVGNHDGIASSFAMRSPMTSIREAMVRGPFQSQSGLTTSVGWW